MRFLPAVEQILGQSGWTPSRHSDVGRLTDLLIKEGHFFPPVVLDILGNLGGLHVQPPFKPGLRVRPGEFHFDPLEAAGGEWDRFEEWNMLAGRQLVPIGGIMLWILTADAEGGVYIGYEGAIDVLGPIQQALEYLCLGEPIPKRTLSSKV